MLALTFFSQSTPQWLFPIWFEDANGHRDTVYIGYDPSAGISNTFDEEFEEYIWVDTTKFNVVMNRFSTYSPSDGFFYSDSAKKIEIIGESVFGSNLNFIKGQMPVLMYWDMSLFYSNDLPYLDLSPYPNSVGQIECGAGEPGYVNCPSAFDDDPLSMVDSINIYYEYPITSPHMFEGSGIPPFDEPEEVLSSFYIRVQPYQLLTGLESNSIVNNIYPNPFSDYFIITSNENINSIKIYDNVGKLILEERNAIQGRTEFITSEFPDGIYLLQIQLKNAIESTILIKQ